MLKSIVAAFSTYSKIPMPRIEWDEKSMKYSMCCFPLVGLVTGFLCVCCYYVFDVLSVGKVLSSVTLSLLPILVTGGIHMDGFLDTIDAASSYRSKEERLRILKDPHTGAFAIIYGIVYMFISFGLFTELGERQIVFVAAGYVYSRILSGLSVVCFRKAKKDGMLAEASAASDKKVKWILAVELVICVAGILFMGIAQGDKAGIGYAGACIAAGIFSFLYYRSMAYKWFGGTTGDLAGYFLQVCECMILLMLVVVKYLILLFW